MKGQEDTVPPVEYLHRVNALKRALKKGLTKAKALVADNGQGKHVVTEAYVAKNNANLRRCKRRRCGIPFLTAVHNQIFCSVKCRESHYKGR